MSQKTKAVTVFALFTAGVMALSTLLPAWAQGDPMKGLNAKAPALTSLKYVQGSPVALADGKNYTVVEFWATWCPPCRRSIPHLNELYKTYKDKGVGFVGITDETEADVTPFIKKMGDSMTYPVALDADSAIWKEYSGLIDSQGIPTAVIVDPKGLIAWKGHPMDPAFEEFLKSKASKTSAAAPPAQSGAAK